MLNFLLSTKNIQFRQNLVSKGVVSNYGKGGGATKWERGHVSNRSIAITPMKRGGGQTSFSHAEGVGGTTSFGIVYTWKLEVLAILKGGGGRKKFPLFKRRGGAKHFTLS